jgi:alpha-beta hydrolase superfamily lysophospholipase
VAGDGRELRYRVVAGHPATQHLLYVHGIESHGGWFLPAAFELRRHGFTSWLLDRRGSGLNRGLDPGHAPSARVLLDDVRRMRERIVAHAGAAPLHLAGMSWGGKLATAAALDEPRGLRSLVLIAPGLRSLVDLPWHAKAEALLAVACRSRKRFEVPIRPEMFTRTAELVDFIRADPWRVESVTAQLLWVTRALDRLVRNGVAGLVPPVLLLLAGDERIVDNDAVLRLLAALPPGRLTMRRFEDASHALQLERPAELAREVARFTSGLRC